MPHICHKLTGRGHALMLKTTIIALLATLPLGTASAQILLDGEWSPQYHEDQPERIPGPDLVDYQIGRASCRERV